jgi:hypothetical protein
MIPIEAHVKRGGGCYMMADMPARTAELHLVF